MKTKWIKSDQFIAGYPAIKLKGKQDNNGQEHCLSGKYGEIWVYSENPLIYSVLITRKSIVKKELNIIIKKDEEHVIKITPDQLNKWVKLIKLPKNHGRQIHFAENR